MFHNNADLGQNESCDITHLQPHASNKSTALIESQKICDFSGSHLKEGHSNCLVQIREAI